MNSFLMGESHLNLSAIMSIEIASENSLIVYLHFDQKEGGNHSEIISALMKIIAQNLSGVIIDMLPSYQSILISFDIFKINHDLLTFQIDKLAKSVPLDSTLTNKEIVLPVYYHESVGVDLARIAMQATLSSAEVIELHQSRIYTVQTIGFAPGFAYLGDVDSRIATPRLSTPRVHVPKGAVAIANNQTAIYPQASPGGWNIIGLCPTLLFNPKEKQPLLLNVGDKVKFTAIDLKSFLAQGGIIDSDFTEDN